MIVKIPFNDVIKMVENLHAIYDELLYEKVGIVPINPIESTPKGYLFTYKVVDEKKFMCYVIKEGIFFERA